MNERAEFIHKLTFAIYEKNRKFSNFLPYSYLCAIILAQLLMKKLIY